MRFSSETWMLFGWASCSHPATDVHMSNRSRSAGIDLSGPAVSHAFREPSTHFRSKKIHSQNLKKNSFFFSIMIDVSFQTAIGIVWISNVLPNQSPAGHVSTFGVHQSEIGWQTRCPHPTQVPVSSQSTTGVQSRTRRITGRPTNVQRCGQFQSHLLRRWRNSRLAPRDHGSASFKLIFLKFQLTILDWCNTDSLLLLLVSVSTLCAWRQLQTKFNLSIIRPSESFHWGRATIWLDASGGAAATKASPSTKSCAKSAGRRPSWWIGGRSRWSLINKTRTPSPAIKFPTPFSIITFPSEW